MEHSMELLGMWVIVCVSTTDWLSASSCQSVSWMSIFYCKVNQSAGPSGTVRTKYLWWTLYYLSDRHVASFATITNINLQFNENIWATPHYADYWVSSQESDDVNELDILYCMNSNRWWIWEDMIPLDFISDEINLIRLNVRNSSSLKHWAFEIERLLRCYTVTQSIEKFCFSFWLLMWRLFVWSDSC